MRQKKIDMLAMFLQEFAGDAALQLSRDIFSELPNATDAPQAFMQSIADNINSVAADVPLTPDQLDTLFLDRVPVFAKAWFEAELEEDEDDLKAVRQTDGCEYIVRVLGRGLRDPRTMESVATVIRGHAFGSQFTAVAEAAKDVLKPGLPSSDDNVRFETLCRALGSTLSKASESLYKNSLADVLEITDILADDAKPIPSVLGGVMKDCKGRWAGSHPELLSLVDERLRIVRNSEVHRNTEIDLNARTVTFVNINPKGERAAVGPMTESEATKFFRQSTEMIIAMERAFGLAWRRAWMVSLFTAAGS